MKGLSPIMVGALLALTISALTFAASMAEVPRSTYMPEPVLGE